MAIDRIFIYNRPYGFSNQPDEFKKRLDLCKNYKGRFVNHSRERHLTLKGAMANAQGSDSLHLLERCLSPP